MHGTRPERVRAPRLVLCCANRIRLAFLFVGVGQWRLRQQASKQTASLFIRTGHGHCDKADHDVRLLLCGLWLWVGSQPRLPCGRHSSGTRSRDGRQPSVATSHLMGLTGPIDGAGPPSLPGRRAAAGKGTCPPKSMARSYGRLVWGRGFCLVVVAC